MRKALRTSMYVALAGALVVGGLVGLTWASALDPGQQPYPGIGFTKFKDPMPVFGPGTNGVDPPGLHPRVSGNTPVVVRYRESGAQNPLPSDFVYPTGFKGTYIWGYKVSGLSAQNHIPFTSPIHWPGFTIESHVGKPTRVAYFNELPLPGQSFLQPHLTVDQTIHWANPLGLDMMSPDRFEPFQGPVPVVTHLHGAEVPSEFDGVPDQWFTANGIKGPLYRSLAPFIKNGAVFSYPNEQQATTLWYHDHGLGITRLNVYGGLAAFYLVRDKFDTGKTSNPLKIPGGPYEMEMVIQDRQFDTNGQLFFPDGVPPGAGLNGDPGNPTIHPFWIPEFFGDTIAVNGEIWPYLKVEPRSYRFRLLNGSNARFYNLAIGLGSVPFHVIGTDGGLLDAPVTVTNLLIAPGERYDVIVNFSGQAEGAALLVTNSAPAPYPDGPLLDPNTSGQVMVFKVDLPLNTAKPDMGVPATLRGGTNQPPEIDRLVNPETGTLAAGVTPAKYRQLVLREIASAIDEPIEVLLNNTKWMGVREDNMGMPTGAPIPSADSHLSKIGPNYLTELPQIGTTEVWEIINTTGDAHPIHLHLVQFQLMNRQNFDTVAYEGIYNDAFGGAVIPGYGPPYAYDNKNNPDYQTQTNPPTLGGNPKVPLLGPATGPKPEERGWKDTVVMLPGQVTRIAVRWAKQDGSPYGFDATGLRRISFNASNRLDTAPGYVWHCHILDHEDNEMMRPYIPVNNANNVYP